MDKLWSPWRSKYIESFNKDSGSGCIFCDMQKLSVKDNDNLLVDKDEFTFTVLNLYPYNNGHLMVVPYRHTNVFESLSENESSEVMKKLQTASAALTKIYKPQGFNIGANLGQVSGAGIHEHLHFHIVPRWNGDTNFMPVLGEVKIISQDLLETKEKLIEAYKELK